MTGKQIRISKTKVFVTCPVCRGKGKVDSNAYTIGQRFRVLRGDRTQEEIAEALGVSRMQIANIESDRSRPGMDTLLLAAEHFKCSVDRLLGRVG